MKVGVVVLTANDRKRSYDSIRTTAQQAESDDFDNVWLADHVMYRNPGAPTRVVWEAWTLLTAPAEGTQRVEIGTLVLRSAFRNPVVLAKMATTADEVSQSRLILGIGAGWHEPEHAVFGVPFDHRVDRFEEALQILKQLLRDGHVGSPRRSRSTARCNSSGAVTGRDEE